MICQTEPKYLPLLFDFITNIENLKRGNTMDYEFISFVKGHESEINDINTRLKKIHDDFRSIVGAVNSQIIERCQSNEIKQWAYRELPEFYDTAVTDIYLDSVNITIDSRIDLDGWQFMVFTRNNKNGFNLNEYLQVRSITFTVQDNRLKLAQHFEIQENVTVVADYIIGLVEKLLDKKA